MRERWRLKFARCRGDAPARARNILRRDGNVLLEARQLPIIGIVREGKTGLARETDHGVVGAQRVAEQPRGAERGGAAFEVLQERGADAMALPAVVDRQAKRETPAVSMKHVARLAGD